MARRRFSTWLKTTNLLGMNQLEWLLSSVFSETLKALPISLTVRECGTLMNEGG